MAWIAEPSSPSICSIKEESSWTGYATLGLRAPPGR